MKILRRIASWLVWDSPHWLGYLLPIERLAPWLFGFSINRWPHRKVSGRTPRRVK